MNNYTELLEKAQSEFLSGLKQAQDLNVATVERTVAFTTELFEARKQYFAKLTDLITSAAKN